MNKHACNSNLPPKPFRFYNPPRMDRSALNLDLGGEFQSPLPTDGAPAPVDLDAPIAQPLRIDGLEHGRTYVDVLIGATLAGVDNGGRGLVARGRVLDVDCGAALGVVVGVGGIVHHLDGKGDDEVVV